MSETRRLKSLPVSTSSKDQADAGTGRWITSWQDVQRAQLEQVARATPAQRLAWLEEALRLAYACGALKVRRTP